MTEEQVFHLLAKKGGYDNDVHLLNLLKPFGIDVTLNRFVAKPEEAEKFEKSSGADGNVGMSLNLTDGADTLKLGTSEVATFARMLLKALQFVSEEVTEEEAA